MKLCYLVGVSLALALVLVLALHLDFGRLLVFFMEFGLIFVRHPLVSADERLGLCFRHRTLDEVANVYNGRDLGLLKTKRCKANYEASSHQALDGVGHVHHGRDFVEGAMVGILVKC